MSFVHLHTHSHYSLLDGLGKIDDLVEKALEYKMPALALTDHGVMYGAVEFYQKCVKAGIKPIIGVEAYVARNGHQNKNSKEDTKPYHLILLAKNEQGYKNLVKLTSIAHLEGYYYKPRIDFKLLEKHHEGLICLTACLQGELPNHILSDNLDAARDMISRYNKLFGDDNFYLEVQYHPNIEKQKTVNDKIFELSKEMGVSVVATNDIHYPSHDDAYAQDVLLCIQTKKTLADEDRMSYMGIDLSFKSPQQMSEEFSDHLEALENTVKVADMCNFEMKLGENVLPNFPLPKGRDADQQLRFICEEGLVPRYSKDGITQEIKERLDYELGVIKKTGYAGYFLIVADFISWAKDNGIVVGPGRGSAAGSIVAYLTKITDLDPIKYNLLFERFLNPERISMPDIDTDFADIRRDDVLQYVTQKYGKDRVAQIITFGTMAARAAIRDVGRAMSLPYNYCDTAAKMVPMFTKLDEAIAQVSELKELASSGDGEKLINTAKRLEGVVRHASTHACGVVITPEPLDNYAPRQYGSHGDDSIVVQYEMHGVEDLGLLKMDFLGLSNLTIIEQALEIIEKIHSKKLDIGKIPLDDNHTFKLFQEAGTTGCFQFESQGMKRYLKQLAPTDIEDLIAMVALYRPGPMEYIPDYINGKHGRKKITYLHQKLEPILETTYGVAVYQEQLLRIARDLAGFSYGEADILRKAVGKKIKELLDEQAVKMVDGMVSNGIDRSIAKKIWEFILPFASYGFNRSHAACYALIGYQTAYLKAHYPAEFMAALLTSDRDNFDRIAIEVDECRQMGIEVLAPDINESYSTFTVVADSLKIDTPRIRFGLLAVKGLGENVVKTIVKERKDNGNYKNLEDFLSRVKTKDLNKRSIDALIKSGSLDSFDDRGTLLANMDRILSFVSEMNNDSNINQNSLFDMMPHTNLPGLKLEKGEEIDPRQKLIWEKELLNLYISEHPLDQFKDKIRGRVVECSSLKNCGNDANVRIAGVVSTIKKIITKKGAQMVFAKIEDSSGSIEILVFPKILEQNPNLWQEGNIIVCSGKISDKDGETKVLCDQVAILTFEDVDDILDKFMLTRTSNLDRGFNRFKKKNGNGSVSSSIIAKKVSITLEEPLDYDNSLRIKEVFLEFIGNNEIELIVKRQTGTVQKIKTSFRVNYNDKFVKALEEIIGEGRVAVL